MCFWCCGCREDSRWSLQSGAKKEPPHHHLRHQSPCCCCDKTGWECDTEKEGKKKKQTLQYIVYETAKAAETSFRKTKQTKLEEEEETLEKFSPVEKFFNAGRRRHIPPFANSGLLGFYEE